MVERERERELGELRGPFLFLVLLLEGKGWWGNLINWDDRECGECIQKTV